MLVNLIERLDRLTQEIKELKERRYLHKINSETYVMSKEPKFTSMEMMLAREEAQRLIKQCLDNIKRK
jgi:inorganic pyrophosphatase